MKAKDITVGGIYRAQVNGQLTTVRVLAIDPNGSGQTRYRVRNEATGRETVFRSPSKFRGLAGAHTELRRASLDAEEGVGGTGGEA